MLTDDQIQNNQDKFLKLVSTIESENIDTEGLVNYLFTTDFFEAPASTKYGCSYKGGLVQHILNTYRILKHMVKMCATDYEKVQEEVEDPNQLDLNTNQPIKVIQEKIIAHPHFSDSEIKVAALFYAINKVNFYELYTQNKKVYKPDGSKFDALGKFDWVTEYNYKVKDVDNRETYGSKGLNAFMILKDYLPLLDEFKEAGLAILNQYDEDDEIDAEFRKTLNKHPLILLLHTADQLAYYTLDN